MLTTIAVVVLSPRVSSTRVVGEMRRLAQDITIDIVEVHAQHLPGVTYQDEVLILPARNPMSTLCESIIARLKVLEEFAGLGKLTRWISRNFRRRIRPISQRIDRTFWPVPRPAKLNSFADELRTLMANYDRCYLICLDDQSFPRAIKLSQLLPFDAAGSFELFKLVIGALTPQRSM